MTNRLPEAGRPIRGARTVVSDYMAVLGARGAGVVLALASVVLTTRLLGAETYGRLNYLLVVPFLIVTIGSAWNAAAVLTVGREEIEAHDTLGRTTWARMLTTAPLVVVAGVGILVARVVFGAYEDYSWALLGLAMGLAVLLVVSEHATYLMQAAGRVGLSAVTQTVQRALTVAGIGALLVFAPSSGLFVFLALSVATSLLVAIWLMVLVGRKGVQPLSIEIPYLRRLLGFSMPLIVSTIGAFVIRWCDIVIINTYGTYQDVGLYALAYQGYENLVTLTVAAVSVFTPLVVSLRLADRLEDVRRYYARLVPQAVALSSLALGVAAAPAHAVVPVVFGAEFSAAADPLVVLLAALGFTSAVSLLAVVLLGLHRTRAMATATIAGVVVNVVLGIALVPLIGIVGASLATAAATLVMGLWLSRAVGHAVGEPTADMAMPALPMLAGIVPVLGWPGPVGYIGGPIAAITTAAVILRLTGLVRRGDAELIARLRVPPRAASALERFVRLADPDS